MPYSLSNLLQSEDAIDSCSTLFMERLSGFASKNETCRSRFPGFSTTRLTVVGEVTFASKLGFSRTGD
jgi:hypothetical protein